MDPKVKEVKVKEGVNVYIDEKRAEQMRVVVHDNDIVYVYLSPVSSFRMGFFFFRILKHMHSTHMCVKRCKNLNELSDYISHTHLCLCVCVPVLVHTICVCVWNVTNSVLIQFDFAYFYTSCMHSVVSSGRVVYWKKKNATWTWTHSDCHSALLKETNDTLLVLGLSFFFSSIHLKNSRLSFSSRKKNRKEKYERNMSNTNQ